MEQVDGEYTLKNAHIKCDRLLCYHQSRVGFSYEAHVN